MWRHGKHAQPTQQAQGADCIWSLSFGNWRAWNSLASLLKSSFLLTLRMILPGLGSQAVLSYIQNKNLAWSELIAINFCHRFKIAKKSAFNYSV